MASTEDPQALLRAELDRYSDADPFGVLRLPSDADHAEVRKAFLLATKRLHPHRFARLGRDVRRMATEVFIHVIKAYQELAHRPDTLEADASAPPAKPVRTSVARGTPYQGMPVAAERRTQAAAKAPPAPHPETPDLDETKLLDDAKAHCRRCQWPEARGIFKRLAVARPQEKSFRVYMHYAWGREYQDAGRLDDARAEYERALHLDPDLEAAIKALATLPRDSQGKKRGLSKLWRK